MDDTDTDDGLAFDPGDDWEPDIVREEAEALASLAPDLGNRATFEPETKVDFDKIGERFKPHDGGLKIGADGDRLRDDLAKLKKHAADLKLRALLEKAEQAMNAERFADAWTHVEAALEMAPTSVAALLLGARCQHALGAYEAALDLLATARPHARGADEVTLVVRLREICDHSPADEAEAERLAKHARALARQATTLAEAADVMEEAINKSPTLRAAHEHRLRLWRKGVLT